MSEGQGDLWSDSQVSGLSSQMGGGDYVFFVSLSPFIEKKRMLSSQRGLGVQSLSH